MLTIIKDHWPMGERGVRMPAAEQPWLYCNLLWTQSHKLKLSCQQIPNEGFLASWKCGFVVFSTFAKILAKHLNLSKLNLKN